MPSESHSLVDLLHPDDRPPMEPGEIPTLISARESVKVAIDRLHPRLPPGVSGLCLLRSLMHIDVETVRISKDMHGNDFVARRTWRRIMSDMSFKWQIHNDRIDPVVYLSR